MKKRTKIFSAILCLALLVGAIVMTVSAADAVPKTNVVPYGAVKVGTSGFTSANIWTTTSSSNDVGTGSRTNNFPTNLTNVYIAQNAEDDGGNKYFKRTHIYDGNYYLTSTGALSDQFYMGNGTGAHQNKSNKTDGSVTADFSARNFEYITVDFDIASDMYLNGTNLSETDTGKLAYFDGMFIEAMPRHGGGSYHRATGQRLVITWADTDGDKVGDAWCWKHNRTGELFKTPLSTVPGEWNHVTFVIKMEYTIAADGGYNYGNTKAYVFINGEYFYDDAVITSSTLASGKQSEQLGFDNFQIAYQPSGSGSKIQHKSAFSTLVDNYSVNYYKKGYAGDLNSFITNGTYANSSLVSCDDVVFNSKYQFETPNAAVATIEANGKTTDYYTVDGALEDIVEGCTLTLRGDTKVENYVATVDFSVVCEKGAFTLGQCDKVALETTTGYEVGKPDNFKYTVVYYPSVEDFEEDANQMEIEGANATATLGQPMYIPEVPGASFGEVVDGVGVNFTLLKGWKLAYSDDDEWQEIDFNEATVIDKAVFDCLKAENDGIICAYPEYEESTLKYIITDSVVVDEATTQANLLLDSKDGYSQYKDITTIDEEITANTNKTIYVKLYTDFRSDRSVAGSNPSITVNGDDVVYLDMNGFDYIVNSDGKNASKATSFTISGAAELHVYSSKAEARIINFSCGTGANPVGYTVFKMDSSSNGAKLYLGAYDDGTNKFSGSNLYVSGPALVILENANTFDKAEKRSFATVNIDGGTYVRPDPDGTGFIAAQGKLDVNVEGDAFFFGYNLISTDARYQPILTMNVDGATFITSNDNQSITNQLHDGSSITFRNTTIRAKVTLAQAKSTTPQITLGDAQSVAATKGNIYFGAGTKLAGGFEITAQAQALEGSVAAVVNEAYKKEFYWSRPSYDTTSWTVKETSLDPVKVTKSATITTEYVSISDNVHAEVVFYGSDKTTVLDRYCIIVERPAFANVNVPNIDLDNPWFDLAYTYWANKATNEEFDSATIEGGKTYELYAVCQTPVADVSAYQNMDLRTKFTLQVYLPRVAEEGLVITVDGVDYVINNVVYKQGTTVKTANGKYTYNGVEYNYFNVAYPSAADLNDTTVKVSVSFDVTVGGVKTALNSGDINIFGLGKYLNAAFDSASDDATKKLILNVMQYCCAVYDLKGITLTDKDDIAKHEEARTYYEDFVSSINANKTLVIDTESQDFKDELDSLAIKDFAIPSELADHVQGVTFYIYANTPTIAIISTSKDITKANVNVGRWMDGTVDSVVSLSKTGDCWRNDSSHVFAEFLGNNYKISVTVGEQTYTFAYNMATYITMLESENVTVESDATPSDDALYHAQAVKVMKALYAYSSAAVEFMITSEN